MQGQFEHELRPKGFETVFTKPCPMEMCWYDCHPLPENVPPVSMPLNCPNQTKMAWRLYGKFCSWACCRSYNFEFMHDSRCAERDTWILHLAYQVRHNVGLDTEKEGNHYHRSILRKDGRGCMRMRIDIPYAMPRLRLQAFGGDLTIEKWREPVVADDHFIPIVLVENARIMESSDLDDMYEQQKVDMLKEQRESALRIEPESCRLAMHVRHQVPPKPLPSVDIMRDRAKLPSISVRHAMTPFDPATERSVLEDKMTAPKAKRGFFAQSQLHIPLTTTPVPQLSLPGAPPPDAPPSSAPVSIKTAMKRAQKSKHK
jgi:hypothetical protein